MPGYNGTGPHSKGPLTGRGLGICRRAVGRIPGNHRLTLPIISVAVMGAAVEDIRNPNGLLRRVSAFLVGVVKNTLSGARLSGKELESINGKRLDKTLKQSD